MLRLNKALHERDLIDAGSEKELSELGEGFFTQGTACIEIIAAWLTQLASRLYSDVAGQAARE